MLASRDRMVRRVREQQQQQQQQPSLSDGEIRAKLVAYTSGTPSSSLRCTSIETEGTEIFAEI